MPTPRRVGGGSARNAGGSPRNAGGSAGNAGGSARNAGGGARNAGGGAGNAGGPRNAGGGAGGGDRVDGHDGGDRQPVHEAEGLAEDDESGQRGEDGVHAHEDAVEPRGYPAQRQHVADHGHRGTEQPGRRRLAERSGGERTRGKHPDADRNVEQGGQAGRVSRFLLRGNAGAPYPV